LGKKVLFLDSLERGCTIHLLRQDHAYCPFAGGANGFEMCMTRQQTSD